MSGFINPVAGMVQMFTGRGFVEPPNPGNTANPPGHPPVETGSWQFIQPQFFQGIGGVTSNIGSIPPAWQDWGEYALNISDISGNTGGGVYSGQATNLVQETDLYYDPSTGIYYNLGNT